MLRLPCSKQRPARFLPPESVERPNFVRQHTSRAPPRRCRHRLHTLRRRRRRSCIRACSPSSSLPTRQAVTRNRRRRRRHFRTVARLGRSRQRRAAAFQVGPLLRLPWSKQRRARFLPPESVKRPNFVRQRHPSDPPRRWSPQLHSLRRSCSGACSPSSTLAARQAVP